VRRRVLIVLALAAALGAGGALVARAFGIRPVQIVSTSMAPKIGDGDWIVVKALDTTARHNVHRGEIVMLRFPLGTSGRAVKRVVAVARDRVAITPRSVTVNDHRIAIAGAPTPYAAGPRVERVPPGHVFLLGDNAKHSIDSRSFGAVPESELVGRMLMAIPTPW
jgi:signal peptidase I